MSGAVSSMRGEIDQPRSSKAAWAAFSCGWERWRISMSAELRGLRFRHAHLNSGLQGGFVGGDHFPERRSAIHQRDGAIAKRWFGAHHRLDQEAGNMNGSKSHKNSNRRIG